jgi:two-component system, OmpR family, sensor histidine kinase MtrB
MAATSSTANSALADLDDGIAPEARSRGILLRPRPARRLGLRARIMLAFGLGALFLSLLLAGTTYALTRQNLLEQREESALTAAYFNARRVQGSLPSEPEDIRATLASLAAPNPIVYQDGVYFPIQAGRNEEDLPPALREAVIVDGDAVRMSFDLDGEPFLAIGIPLPQVQGSNAAYFELVVLTETADTLQALGISLLGASAITTVAGMALGLWASRRALRPLADVSEAAEAIAGGRLDTRLESQGDPDLGALTTSFNDMAQALQDRVERDARFASDVSHELRSPLMTMSAAVDVLTREQEDLPPRSQQAVELVTEEVDRFRQLVEDLLEISRYDAGAVRLDLDDVGLAEFVLQAVEHSGHRAVPIEIDADLLGTNVRADKRRLARVLANLLDNAAKYGEGATSVSLRRVDGNVQLAVEDLGPGVPDEERAQIFDRFNRGGIAGRRGAGEGVGLGLALVAEHVRLHGGRVWVEDRADEQAGARFVVELPTEEDHQ